MKCHYIYTENGTIRGAIPVLSSCPNSAPNSNDMTTDKQTPDKPKRKAQKPQKQPKMDMFTAICKSDLKIEVVLRLFFAH